MQRTEVVILIRLDNEEQTQANEQKRPYDLPRNPWCDLEEQKDSANSQQHKPEDAVAGTFTVVIRSGTVHNSVPGVPHCCADFPRIVTFMRIGRNYKQCNQVEQEPNSVEESEQNPQ